MRGVLSALCALLVLLGFAPNALAQAAPPECRRSCPSVVGGKGVIDISDQQPVKGKDTPVTGRGDASTNGPAPGRTFYVLIKEMMAPTCTGNTREDPSLLCNAAVNTCPGDDQMRFWVWHQRTEVRIDPATGAETRTEFPWDQEPGTFCLGPGDPGVPTIADVIAQVRTEFQRLPLPTFDVRTDPTPTTLVNVPTAFSVGTAEPATFTPTILGTRVTVVAKPVQWEWTFGDGAILTTDNPGVPRRPVVAHEYSRAGDYAVTVRTTWTGTFTIGSETFPIRTPAFTTNGPSPVAVREAAAELVRE